MPRIAIESNERMSMRVRAEEKATLLRAAALENTDLTDFILEHALRSTKAVIEEAEHIRLSNETPFAFWRRWNTPLSPTPSYARQPARCARRNHELRRMA